MLMQERQNQAQISKGSTSRDISTKVDISFRETVGMPHSSHLSRVSVKLCGLVILWWL
jgi:hypothetical protein